MRLQFLLIQLLSTLILSLTLVSCQSEPSASAQNEVKQNTSNNDTATKDNATTADLTDVPDGLKELVKKAVARAYVPTSVKANFGSGYWHLGAAVNTSKPGDRSGYEGIWFKLDENQLMTVGQNEKNLYQGAWTWDEEKAQITFMAPLQDDWWINEWKTINRGDLYICMGNTERNPKSTQFKLVRKHEKVTGE